MNSIVIQLQFPLQCSFPYACLFCTLFILLILS
uniref:Uncharacterized protein n=1 Tax=Anguilla anguilla TaxID=7936 RepID=A0A0E9SPZ4_ANGAN